MAKKAVKHPPSSVDESELHPFEEGEINLNMLNPEPTQDSPLYDLGVEDEEGEDEDEQEAETPKTKTDSSTKLENIINEAINSDVSQTTVPDKTKVTKEQVNSMINRLSVIHGISNYLALIAIFNLCLAGASNKGTPDSLTTTVKDPLGHKTEISKYDLMQVYTAVTKNKYIRRLAEFLATPISTYAEKNSLKGDLAEKLNNRIKSLPTDKDGNKPNLLTQRQKAWASSFNTSNPALEDVNQPDLMVVGKYLAEDLIFRTFKKEKVQTPSPRPNKKGGKKAKTAPKPPKDRVGE